MNLMSAAGMACDSGWRSRARDKIVMMGFFEEKARHEICYYCTKSYPLSSHPCPYLERQLKTLKRPLGKKRSVRHSANESRFRPGPDLALTRSRPGQAL